MRIQKSPDTCGRGLSKWWTLTKKYFFKESNIWLDEWLKSEIIFIKLCKCIFRLRSFPPHISYMPSPSPVQKNKTKQNKQTNKQTNIVIVVYCIMGFLDAGWHLFLNFCTLFKALVNFHWMRYWRVYIFMISYFNRKMGIQFCRLYVMV